VEIPPSIPPVDFILGMEKNHEKEFR